MGTGGAWGVAPVSLFLFTIYCIEVLAFLQVYFYTAIISIYWFGGARWSLI